MEFDITYYAIKVFESVMNIAGLLCLILAVYIPYKYQKWETRILREHSEEL